MEKGGNGCECLFIITEREYREQLLAGDEMQNLRDYIDVKKWEINQAAGRYIRSHEGGPHGSRSWPPRWYLN